MRFLTVSAGIRVAASTGVGSGDGTATNAAKRGGQQAENGEGGLPAATHAKWQQQAGQCNTCGGGLPMVDAKVVGVLLADRDG